MSRLRQFLAGAMGRGEAVSLWTAVRREPFFGAVLSIDDEVVDLGRRDENDLASGELVALRLDAIAAWEVRR